MRAYVAIVGVLNWLVVIALSIAAILWYAGTIPSDFLPPAQAARPEAKETEAEETEAQDPEAGAEKPAPAAEAFTLENAQTIALAGGVALLALNLLAIALRLRGPTRPHYLIFEKEGAGSLKVAVDAIEDTLTKCASGIPEVQEAKIHIVLDKGGKMPRQAIAHCIFVDAPNLFAVQENVRHLLTSRYQEIFPNEELNFEIVVDRLKSERGQDESKKHDDDTQHGAEELEEKPFGPKYPVEQ